MTEPARDGPRYRVWAAAASVGGIVAATTAIGATQLAGHSEPPEPRTPTSGSVVASTTKPQIKIRTPKVKWKLSWSDEFNGQGKPSSNWSFVLGNGTNGWSHKALQYYRDGNAYQDGHGRLVIAATRTGQGSTAQCWYGRCRYASSRIQTQNSFQQAYGRFAVKAKVPTGKGIWPAFWMQRATAPYAEIDIVETIGNTPSVVRGYAHGKKRIGGGSTELPRPLSAGYHVYGVDWTPRRIVWWVDGHPYAQVKGSPGWRFDKPFFLILNVQVGGTWPGAPNAETPFPARMSVDWVRVYRGRT